MVKHQKCWGGALLLLAGLWVPGEVTPADRGLTLQRQARQDDAVRARAERLQAEHLECIAERETLSSTIASKKALCEAEMQRFRECRAERRDLEGAELWGCGLGLAMGVASRLAAEPWKLTECGLAEPPKSRESCPVPACADDLIEIEREVLAEQGVTEMPVCDDPSA
jgi:hypothetical protein